MSGTLPRWAGWKEGLLLLPLLLFSLPASGTASSFLPSLLFPVQYPADSWFPRSFFRSDKLVGTAHLKLERLENECEIREIVEVGWANQTTWQIPHIH